MPTLGIGGIAMDNGRSEKRLGLRRREFLGVTLSAPVILLGGGCAERSEGIVLEQTGLVGGLRRIAGETPLEGAGWYEAGAIGDGVEYRFSPGALAEGKYLTTDMLLDGNHMSAFFLELKEGEEGPSTGFRWAGLNQCSFRVRFPLGLLDLNRWGINREGAFLKPRISGDRIDIAKVDRIVLTVYRKSPKPSRWCMTDLILTRQEPDLVRNPILPKGALLDELGQSRIHDWPAKSRSKEEVSRLIRGQYENAASQVWPEKFSRWGGWKSKKLTAGSGFFSTHKESDRWWMVDPDGYAFWSVGVDCVGLHTTRTPITFLEAAWIGGLEEAMTWIPDSVGEFQDCILTDESEIPGFDAHEPHRTTVVNYVAANIIRALGAEDWHRKWAEIALAELRRLRFNTVGNWSDWQWARESHFPYVRPMGFTPRRTSFVYRDFPDVFHPEFEKDAADYASVLEETAEDPAFIGYFLMNEPTWGFSKELPAAGMLFVTPDCHSRKELAAFLRKKYRNDQALSEAWKIGVNFDQVAAGKWTTRLTEEANRDLREFSVIMAKRYFETISAACREADPNHLNLGMRWAGVPPMWAVEGMKSFDVFSMNCYMEKIPRDVTDEIHKLLEMPIIIGEWHFGALDVGLPSSGIGHLHNQTDRGKAYRVYIEDAAANPNCVGTHWFTLYDESAVGRFDGENYNIGFLDVCNRPYKELSEAGIASHERIYQVAMGEVEPYDDVPEYLPKLY